MSVRIAHRSRCIGGFVRVQSRQWHSLELIASENFTSRAVMDCLGSALTNK